MSQDPRQSRGYRNRNPGNIDFSAANKWKGQLGLGDDWMPRHQRRFAAFEEHRWGIRALAALLTTYQDRHGLRTIRDIINRWAPSVENATGAYVRHVADLTGRDPDASLNLHAWADMRPLVVAIITHELGGNPYSAAEIDEGLRLAGLVPEAPRERARVAARDPATIGKVAGGAAAGGVLLEAAQHAGPALAALGGLDWRVGLGVLAAGAIGYGIWRFTRRREQPA